MNFHFDRSEAYPITIDSEICVGCGLCCWVCTVGAIRQDEGVPQVMSDCIGCYVCISECPVGAISKTSSS